VATISPAQPAALPEPDPEWLEVQRVSLFVLHKMAEASADVVSRLITPHFVEVLFTLMSRTGPPPIVLGASLLASHLSKDATVACATIRSEARVGLLLKLSQSPLPLVRRQTLATLFTLLLSASGTELLKRPCVLAVARSVSLVSPEDPDDLDGLRWLLLALVYTAEPFQCANEDVPVIVGAIAPICTRQGAAAGFAIQLLTKLAASPDISSSFSAQITASGLMEKLNGSPEPMAVLLQRLLA
jgi:hypothetical protein